MRQLFLFLALIILIALPGCNGSGHKLVVGDIQVPDTVIELSSVICEIEASGDTGITYAWAVDPATTGTFDPQDASLTTFSASGVEGDTEVTIRVAISSDHSDPVTKSALLLIKESNEAPTWIRNQPPVADAHASTTSVEPGDVIQFFDDSTDPNGNDDIVSWEWDFSYVESDGFQVESQVRNPEVQFNNEGIYHIQLRVTDAGGLSDILDEPLTVSTILDNHPPFAQAYAVTTVVPEDFFILFHDISTDPDGDDDIIKREWDFSFVASEGFHVDSEERDPYVQFNQEGIFQIQLRVTDAGGLSDELDEPLTVSVVNYPPVAQAYVDNTIVPEDSFVQFHDCSTDPNGYDDIVKWEWDFSYDADEGFQVESEERDPYVQFSVLGEFEVQMRVTDTAGLTDMLNEPIGITVREGGWVITWEDNYPYLKASSIARDKSDNIYMTGTFAGNLDFDPGYGKEIRYGGQGSAYLMKLNTSGELLWVETWGPATAVAIVTDTDSVVYVLGHYSCHDLDPGPGIFEPVAHSGDYLSQFDSNGNFLNSLSTRYHTTLSGFEDYTDYEDRIVNMVPDPPYIYVVHCYYEAHSGEDPQNDYVFWNYNLMKFNQGSVDIMDPDWVN